MTPEERKAAARKELARRELERRGVSPSSTVQTMLGGMDKPVGPSADNGTAPIPIEDQDDKPGWDWLKKNVPMAYNVGHEAGAGLVGGVTQLPNIVPNVVNKAKSLADLNFGKGTGEVAPEDQWRPWMDDEKGFVSSPFKTDEEAYAPIPGYERVRELGRISGSAAPGGFGAMVAAPLLAESGKRAGQVIDAGFGVPNRQWEQNLETLVPLGTGAYRTGAGVLSRSGKTMPEIGVPSYSILSAIDPALPGLVATTGKVAKLGAKGGTGSVLGDLGRTLATTIAPMAADDPRMRGRR